MTSWQEIPQELRRGILFSLLFHLALLLLFIAVTVRVDSLPQSFAEVAFISGTPGGRITETSSIEEPAPAVSAEAESVPLPRPAAARPVKPRPEPAPSVNRTTPAPRTGTEQQQSTPVTPPKRRMLEDEEPLISRQEQGKITPGRTTTGAAALGSSTAPAGGTTGAASGAQTPGSAGSGSGSATTAADRGSGAGAGSGMTRGSGSGQPFTIEGDAAQRLIVKQIIPTYPEGLQQEAVIQFRFTVQPDGRLTGLIPMRKGDPTLEKITLNALRQWLFNPLPANAEQKPVQGLITFRYQLE